jgi:hypothetical protein
VSAPAHTFSEAAALLRLSPRRLRDVVDKYPFYYPNGNRKLFTDGDLENIRTALRAEAGKELQSRKPGTKSCRSASSRLRKTAAPPITPSGDRTLESKFTEARRLISQNSRARSCADGEKPSNVVSMEEHRPQTRRRAKAAP